MTNETLRTSGFGVIAYAKDGGATSCYTTGTWNALKPNFMYNTKVTFSNTPSEHWTYSPLRYWPNDFVAGNVDNKEGTDQDPNNAQGSGVNGKVSFFAYAPYVDLKASQSDDYSGLAASTTHTTHKAFDAYDTSAHTEKATQGIVAVTTNDYTEEPEVKYVLQSTNPSTAVDLLWGTRASTTNYNLADKTMDEGSADKNYNTDLTKQNVGETVDFNFKHALAKIGGHDSDGKTGLQVVLDIDNNNTGEPSTAITGGTKNAQTLVTISDITIKDLNTYNSTTSNLTSSGWFNIAKGTWDNVSQTPGGTFSSQVDNSDVVGTEGWELNSELKEINAPTWDGTNTKWSITGVTTSPQDVYTSGSEVPACLLIPDPTNAQTLVVSITYVVRTYDSKLDVTSPDTEPCTKITQTITNKVTIPAGSLKANKYYKLLMHLGLTSVKFSAVVDSWDAATSNADNDSDANDKDIYLPSNTITTP